MPKHQPFANPTVPNTYTQTTTHEHATGSADSHGDNDVQEQVLQSYVLPSSPLLCKDTCFAFFTHTFQGQSAGPVNQGQQPNAVDRVFVDPGDKKFESGNPGLLYMAVSRATTLGENNTSSSTTTGRTESIHQVSINSAIYFTGHNMTLHRVTNLKLKKNGDEHEKVQLRNKWVARVEANTVGMHS